MKAVATSTGVMPESWVIRPGPSAASGVRWFAGRDRSNRAVRRFRAADIG
jgi:hypothetical protein